MFQNALVIFAYFACDCDVCWDVQNKKILSLENRKNFPLNKSH